MSVNRRQFLLGGFGATVLASMPADLFAGASSSPPDAAWDHGQVRHLLPTVSDTAILIKASFIRPLAGAPSLQIGSAATRGRMNDTAGEFWQFHAAGLQPGRRYTLTIKGADGRPLCSPWDLSTFPSHDARPDRFRVLFFTCAGGHEGLGFLPTATRSRLLRRALTFQPDAVVANGDHVYWDLLSPVGAPNLGASPEAQRLAGSFSRSSLIFGDTNETVLKLAAGPQIVPVRHRLPLDAGVLSSGRPRLLRQRRRDRHHRDVPAVGFHAAPRACQPAALLSRVSPGRQASGWAPVVVVR